MRASHYRSIVQDFAGGETAVFPESSAARIICRRINNTNKKRKGPALAWKVSRATVTLPPKNLSDSQSSNTYL